MRYYFYAKLAKLVKWSKKLVKINKNIQMVILVGAYKL